MEIIALRSKSSALRCLKYGNKQAALRFVRQMKTISQSQGQCTALLNRVEEVHNAMVDAEAPKEVAEAIRIGAQGMKEKSICLDELHIHLEELDEALALQRQAEDTLGGFSACHLVISMVLDLFVVMVMWHKIWPRRMNIKTSCTL